MKTLVLEPYHVLASALFWLVALPFALVAFPTLAIIDRTSAIFRADVAAIARQLDASTA